MTWVDDADVQIHLPVDTLKVEEVPDDLAKAKEYGERVVRGYLSGHFASATIAGWTEPDLTPPEIRLVTGMLAGAHIYRLRFGQSSLTDPQYAQVKYNEAMKMLMDIVGDVITITDPTTGDPISDSTSDFSADFFQPNDGTTDTPKFTMGAQF